MLFAADNALDLPCHFSQLIEGEQYHDGRRYLPTIVLTLQSIFLRDGMLK